MDYYDKDKKILLSRANDVIRLAQKNYVVKTLGFLSPYERKVIEQSSYTPDEISVRFFGGYEAAERTMMICVPEYVDENVDEVITVLKISSRDLSGITHRDYLGSVLGLGITRENIGDILVSDNGAYIFVKSEIADFCKNNLGKVKKAGVCVDICRCCDAEIPEPKVRIVKGTVQSFRLDAVLSLATGLSRTASAELIKQGRVFVNWEEADSGSKPVCEGDFLSVRGKGRMKVGNIGGTTRKGRSFIEIEVYE